MADLLLTLGHNASAIAISVKDGIAVVENAYELERLSGVKSDSRFPLDAMIALKERGVSNFERVYVTHWDPMNNVDELKPKYWDRSVFPSHMPVYSQESLGLSHHDCHAYAAVAFAGDTFPKRDSGVLVIDGFGNMSEHISYYRLNQHGKPELLTRLYGYSTSLGLMYQYATSFLGMKMHEDEYKLLGYGSKIYEVDVLRGPIDDLALFEATRLLKRMRSIDGRRLEVTLDVLPEVQEEWANRFRSMLDRLGMQGIPSDSFEARVVIGYIVQRMLEITVQNLFMREIPIPTNLIITGGVAFNVELNRKLITMMRGKVCAMPLAGDQGNSLGLWAFHNHRARLDFGDLCWGRRNYEYEALPDGMQVFESDGPEVLAALSQALDEVGFVNLVRGRMEFGPRALCNTTTLALPTQEIAEEINRINGRNSVMPFAPVVWHLAMPVTFQAAYKLHKSDAFMISALPYIPDVGQKVQGAALFTPDKIFTGRPQSYKPKYENDSVGILLQTKQQILINTSFNVHGVPICCDMKDVIHSHQFQHNLNPNVRTIVITDGA